MVIFVVSVCIVVITSFFILPTIFNVNKVRIKVLSLFIDIPQNNVLELAGKCEDFLMKIEHDHQEDHFSHDDNINIATNSRNIGMAL